MRQDNRSKMGYLKEYSDIQDRINKRKLDMYDFVYCLETRQLYIIDEDLNTLSCKTQFDVYANESEANIAINKLSYTYPGQIVIVQTAEDGLMPYVVQLDENNKYHVVSIVSQHIHTIIDYNLAEHRPIDNITATNEIFISDLVDGYYMIVGNYRFSPDDPTHRMTSSKILFAVQHEIKDGVDVSYITEFNPTGIRFYTAFAGFFSSDKYVLQSELEAMIDAYLDAHLDEHVDDYVGTNETTPSQIDSLFGL